MRQIIAVAATALLLGGCGPIHRRADFSTVTYTPSVSVAKLSLREAAASCKSAIPFVSDPLDDGDRVFSIFGSVNVSMSTPYGRIVCSVDSATRSVQRIHNGKREIALLEFLETAEAIAAQQVERDAMQQESRIDGERFSYKGVRIGDSVERVKIALPHYSCWVHTCGFNMQSCLAAHSTSRSWKTGTPEGCSAASSFGGAAVLSGEIRIIDNKVASIRLTLDTLKLPQLSVVLTEKFGKPSHSENSTSQNRMGAKFENWERQWKLKDDRLVAQLRTSVIDEGSVLISGSAADQQDEDRLRDRVRQGAEDF